MMGSKVLALVPARGGSKGIPGKNIRKLAGKSLILYTVDYLRKLFADGDICVSTDSKEICDVVASTGLDIPFIRPAELATDTASSYEVVKHALQFYKDQGRHYEVVALFQPTSPFRLKIHYTEALAELTDNLDMVMSVARTKSNPYYVLMEENENGYLEKSKAGNFLNRQAAPVVFEINGAIYLCHTKSLNKYSSFGEFRKVKKYLMDDIYSVDIDTELDWKYAEFLVQKGMISFD
jgi:N-acylneuraminate cytidylyltransferase